MKSVEILINLTSFFILRNCFCARLKNKPDAKDLKLNNVNNQTFLVQNKANEKNFFESDILLHFSSLIKISIEQLKILEEIKYEQSFITELFDIVKWFIKSPFDQAEFHNRDYRLSYLAESINSIDDFKSLLEKRKEYFDGPVPLSGSILNVKCDLNLINDLLPSIIDLFTNEQRKSNSSEFIAIIDELNVLEKLNEELMKDIKNYSGLITKNNEFFHKKSKIFEYKTELENESKYLLSKKRWGTRKYGQRNDSLFENLKKIFNDVTNYLNKEKDLLNSIFKFVDDIRASIERYEKCLKEIKEYKN